MPKDTSLRFVPPPDSPDPSRSKNLATMSKNPFEEKGVVRFENCDSSKARVVEGRIPSVQPN